MNTTLISQLGANRVRLIQDSGALTGCHPADRQVQHRGRVSRVRNAAWRGQAITEQDSIALIRDFETDPTNRAQRYNLAFDSARMAGHGIAESSRLATAYVRRGYRHHCEVLDGYERGVTDSLLDGLPAAALVVQGALWQARRLEPPALEVLYPRLLPASSWVGAQSYEAWVAGDTSGRMTRISAGASQLPRLSTTMTVESRRLVWLGAMHEGDVISTLMAQYAADRYRVPVNDGAVLPMLMESAAKDLDNMVLFGDGAAFAGALQAGCDVTYDPTAITSATTVAALVTQVYNAIGPVWADCTAVKPNRVAIGSRLYERLNRQAADGSGKTGLVMLMEMLKALNISDVVNISQLDRCGSADGSTTLWGADTSTLSGVMTYHSDAFARVEPFPLGAQPVVQTGGIVEQVAILANVGEVYRDKGLPASLRVFDVQG